MRTVRTVLEPGIKKLEGKKRGPSMKKEVSGPQEPPHRGELVGKEHLSLFWVLGNPANRSPIAEVAGLGSRPHPQLRPNLVHSTATVKVGDVHMTVHT